MSNFWKKTSFWNMVIQTLALFGTPVGMGAGAAFPNSPGWLVFGGVCAILSAGLAIWMKDKDNNGIVDIFEKNKL